MAKSISIKNDLFRFVTVRTPNLLNQLTRQLRFVFHPDVSLSLIGSCEGTPRGEGGKVAFQAYLATFYGVSKYAEIQAIHSDLYNFSRELFRKRDITQFTNLDVNHLQLSPAQVVQIFDQLFYQIISKSSKYVREACIQMLIADHVVKNQTALIAAGLKKVSDIKIVIPQVALRCIKSWYPAACRGELHGVNRLGIADFRRVEQEVCCYVPGEVSHIENILGREFKERTTRNLVRTELTTETTREVEMENMTDTTTTTRNELSSEVASVLEESKTANYGGSFGISAQYPPEVGPEIRADAYVDFSNVNSSSFSNTTAKNYAEEVTRKAVERILQRNTTKRTSKITKEFEENNKHGFDNRGSDLPVTGILRWIDMIYTNRLINYGKHLVLEFLIPEPATLFKNLLAYQPQKAPIVGIPDPKTEPEKPKTLTEFGISNAASVTQENAAIAAGYYGVNIAILPPATLLITKNITPPTEVEHQIPAASQNQPDIIIPADYEADTVDGTYTWHYKAPSAWSGVKAFCDMYIGGQVLESERHYSGSWKSEDVTVSINFDPNVGGTIPLSFTYARIGGYSGTIEINCVLKAAVFLAWQTNLFNQFTAAYNSLLADYNNQMVDSAAVAAQESEQKDQNVPPGMKRIIEQRELKRACIDMITRPFCREVGKKLYEEIDACEKYKIPKIFLTNELDDYASQVKFFEQAFEWQMMSYLFYPYYWAHKCDWGDLFQQADDDLVFQAFKQSGMARVLVPVRPECTEAVMYYLETGDIWLGGDLVAETDDDLYLSIAEELQIIEGQVEDEWETRVPTTLTLAQQFSAKLDEGGLPCCHDRETNEMQINGIKPSTNTLKFLDNEPSTL